jgi:hypothetical protein
LLSFRIITDLRLAEFQLGLVWPVTLAGPETLRHQGLDTEAAAFRYATPDVKDDEWYDYMHADIDSSSGV